ncbi:hypothetical protein B0H13DRAFT_2371184 [Mycena leptocephala]|nr:hypothetical protein B0H13DRAFT_2371184 [Mycena leptocephala]
MLSKLSIVIASMLITIAAASPTTTPVAPRDTPNQCCQNIVQSTDPSASWILSFFQINTGGIAIPVGLTCVSFTDGDTCDGVKATCDTPNGAWGGLIALNCIRS